MRTTLGTRTTVQTSGDEEGFKGPEDIGDIGGFGGELGGSSGSPSRRSPMGGIDLGKGIDLEKPRAPRSGIGFEVGKSPAGNLGLGLEIPLPVAAPVSARGGVSIDPATGEIRGGYGGLGIGKGPIGASVDVGVDTPKGSGDFGCFKYVTFNVGPFSHTVSKNECEPKKPLGSTPTPSGIDNDNKGFGPNPSKWPLLKPNCYYVMIMVLLANEEVHENCLGYGSGDGSFGYSFSSIYKINSYSQFLTGVIYNNNSRQYDPVINEKIILGSVFSRQSSWIHIVKGDLLKDQPNNLNLGDGVELGKTLVRTGGYAVTRPQGYGNSNWPAIFQQRLDWYNSGRQDYTSYTFIPLESCFDKPANTPILNELILSPSFSLPSGFASPSISNPPPTKRKMDDKCCKAIIQLQLETLRLLGRQLGPNGVMAQSKEKGFIGEEIERTLTPIDNPNNPEKVKVRFTTVYQMLMYGLKQGIALDTALDPESYKVPTGKLQNPAYSRDSEHSLKSNDQPSKDKAGNNRELEINKDDAVKMSGFLQQQSYMFEAVKRLEYLFPAGELADTKFDKSLIIPGATGEIKVHNLIHFQEFLAQYINATLGDPKIPIIIEDNNSIKEGKQEAIFKHFSIAQMIRELYKITLESGDDINAIMETAIRNFRTSLANRIQIVQVAEMVQALVEDTGMLEFQEFIPLKLDGDPYAGKWKAGMGFEPDNDLDKNEEAITEKLMRATLNNFEAQIKVIRRDKRENSDIRDLLIQIAEMFTRTSAIPATGEGIEKALAAAKFKTQVDMALTRSQVKRAATASRSRTKKRKKQ